jgi:hypothetical protein
MPQAAVAGWAGDLMEALSYIPSREGRHSTDRLGNLALKEVSGSQ